MPTPVETLASINEKSLEVLETVQDRILEAYKGAASALPTDRLPAMPAVLPYDSGDVVDLVKEAFAFQSKVLEADRAFTLGLLEVLTPAAPAKPAAKSAK
jgi:hypothetical protein